jgi:hypothetical protein
MGPSGFAQILKIEEAGMIGAESATATRQTGKLRTTPLSTQVPASSQCRFALPFGFGDRNSRL